MIAGASGMIGQLILNKCLADSSIQKVVSLVRKSSKHPSDKLEEILVADFANLDNHQEHFKHLDAAFFCIGAYTGKVKDDLFKMITVNYTVEFASQLKVNSPDANLCLLSGAGADRTEKSSTSFARYKGMAENQIHAMGLHFFTFRPGYIYPVTPRTEPNIMYRIMRSLYPLLKLLGPNASITSEELAEAMFRVGINGHNAEVIENKDIRVIAL